MLVLSRKLGERIFIGDNIVVTIVDIDRGKIRLGIECPREIPVYREELLPASHALRSQTSSGSDSQSTNKES